MLKVVRSKNRLKSYETMTIPTKLVSCEQCFIQSSKIKNTVNVKNVIKNIIFLFIVTLSQSQQSHSCTILDMSHYSNTSDSISLSWDLSSECTYWNFQTFKITVRHVKFLACNNQANNSATTYKTDKQLITLKNLHPFSLYGIRTVLITGTITSDIETTLKISTPPSAPQFDQREAISTTMPWNRPSSW